MDVDFIKHRFEDGHVGVLTRTKFKLGIRHVQLIYMFVCSVVFGILRGSTGIYLLALTDPLRRNDTYIQVYDWSSHIQGSVFSSFMFGQALMIVPAEFLLRRLEAKTILACTLFASGALYVSLPTIIKKGGWMALCNAQFILGMSQACLVPANKSLIYKWVPPIERSWCSPIIFGGVQMGIIISLPLCASLSKASLGWELIFYSLAMMTLSYAVVWIALTASSPDDHPAIGDKEKEFIQEALGYYRKKLRPTPWSEILRSSSFWGITCAHVGTNVVFVFFLLNLPAYLVHGLSLPLFESACYMILPFITIWLTYVTAKRVLEMFYKIGFISYTTSFTKFRKYINSLGVFGSIFGLCLLAYFGPLISNGYQVVLLSGILGATGLQYVGFLENFKDVSENYAGSLVTISSFIANTVGAVVPLITGLLVNGDLSDFRQWRIVFMGLALVAMFCNLFYIWFSSTERQYWDTTDNNITNFGYYNDVHQVELDELNSQNMTDEKKVINLQ